MELPDFCIIFKRQYQRQRIMASLIVIQAYLNNRALKVRYNSQIQRVMKYQRELRRCKSSGMHNFQIKLIQDYTFGLVRFHILGLYK